MYETHAGSSKSSGDRLARHAQQTSTRPSRPAEYICQEAAKQGEKEMKVKRSLNKTSRMLAAAFALLALSPFAMAQADKHLSRVESVKAAISKPQPEYPELARQLKLWGDVDINAFVSEEGTVERVEVVSGNPVLAKSAQEALLKWKFGKQVVDGKPVKFVADVEFKFEKR
jgi:TonB family protein